MAKKGSVKLTWIRSPSPDARKQLIKVNYKGAELLTSEVGPEVEQLMVQIPASGPVDYSVVTIDDDGLVATSDPHTFVIGDLEAPLPATGLDHQIVGIIDDTPPEPPAPPA